MSTCPCAQPSAGAAGCRRRPAVARRARPHRRHAHDGHRLGGRTSGAAGSLAHTVTEAGQVLLVVPHRRRPGRGGPRMHRARTSRPW